MTLKLLKKSNFFCLTVVKPIGLLIFCFAYLIGVSAQVSDRALANNSTCESARFASGEGNYGEASNLIKSCLEQNSQNDAQSHAENLLFASEIEYSLGKDTQASEYAALAESHYNSLGDKIQKDYWWFGVKLKKIRADLEIEAGNYESATKFYKEGLAILTSTNKTIKIEGGEPRRLKANLLSGISFVELKTGLYSEAVKNLESALAELSESSLDNYCRAGILNDFGHLLNEQRSHRQAVGYLVKSAEIWQHEKEWFNFSITQQNLAIAFRGMENYKQSQIYFERVRDLAVKNNFVDLETMSLQGIASIYQIRGEHQPAIEILQKALGQTSASIRRAEILWRLSASQNQTGENAAARTNATECFEWATVKKIENLRYLCATNLGESYLKDSPHSAEKWFRAAIDITENLSRRVSGDEYGKVYFMQDKASAYHKLINLLMEKNQIAETFAVGEKLKSRVLREKSENKKNGLLNENGLNIPNFPAEDLAVSFIETADKCFVFAIKTGQIIKIAQLPIGTNELRKKINQYRESILSFSPTLKAEGKELYELLLGEFEKEINGSKRLIIVPDGALWELPFQALIDATSGKYLMEEHEIFYTPSVNFLPSKPPVQSKRNQQKFVAFANPSRKDSPALPEAEREANSIGKLYSSSDVFVKNEATKANFLREAGQAEVLHIAVHGVVNAENPFDSALLFSENADDDGRLTVPDILKMDLQGSLLVLSSCDTSSGRVINGEGLLSLSWAFLASGGKDVVAAQWSVEEKATADLMLNFYKTLKNAPNETPNALRAAQLEALKSSAPFNHPFYWAGFVVVGGPQR